MKVDQEDPQVLEHGEVASASVYELTAPTTASLRGDGAFEDQFTILARINTPLLKQCRHLIILT